VGTNCAALLEGLFFLLIWYEAEFIQKLLLEKNKSSIWHFDIRRYVKATLEEILLIDYVCSICSLLFITKNQIISMKLFLIATILFHVGIQVISLEMMHVSSHGV
jgi:hypothetical protein